MAESAGNVKVFEAVKPSVRVFMCKFCPNLQVRKVGQYLRNKGYDARPVNPLFLYGGSVKLKTELDLVMYGNQPVGPAPKAEYNVFFRCRCCPYEILAQMELRRLAQWGKCDPQYKVYSVYDKDTEDIRQHDVKHMQFSMLFYTDDKFEDILLRNPLNLEVCTAKVSPAAQAVLDARVLHQQLTDPSPLD